MGGKSVDKGFAALVIDKIGGRSRLEHSRQFFLDSLRCQWSGYGTPYAIKIHFEWITHGPARYLLFP